MDLVAVSRNMVDTIGGSWLACRDLLRVLGQLAPTCPALANLQKVISGMLRERFPGLDRFLRLQHHVHRLELINVFYEAIEWPMPIEEMMHALLQSSEEQERSIVRAQRLPWANRGIRKCSVKACGRPLGRNLLWFPAGTEDFDLETDLYGTYPWEHPYPHLSTVGQLHKHLTAMRMYNGECQVYSERRNRLVSFYQGCFACSGRCYKDIVNALWLWEGPREEEQVVVITVSAHETSREWDWYAPHQWYAPANPQRQWERGGLPKHRQKKPPTLKQQRKKFRKQLANRQRRKREQKGRRRQKKKEQSSNGKGTRAASRNNN